MGDLVESASRIFAQAQWRVEVSAQNIANATTPGYKRRVAFSDVELQSAANLEKQQSTNAAIDLAPGKFVETGSNLDLAVLGRGFFAVRGSGDIYYTRKGQFTHESDGRLLGPGGMALQLESGGDLVVKSADFKVNAEGVVTENGEPVGRLAIVDLPAAQLSVGPVGGLFSAADAQALDVADRAVGQGALEASNVTLGDEMVVMMEALRRAETAQRLVNTYDDLLGRAISSFGQA